jgi:hypothetical protein
MPEEFRSWFWICRDGISKQATATGRVVAVKGDGRFLTGDIVHRTVSLASIDDNAVSQILSNTISGTQSVTAGIGLTADADWNAVAITTTGFAIAIDATGTFAVAGIGGLVVCLLTVRRDGSDIGSVSFDMAAAWLQVLAINSSNPAAWTWPVTLSLVDMPAAGAHTYTIHLHVTCSVGTHDQVIDGTNTMLKVREIKK